MRISDWSSDVCSSDLVLPARSADADHAGIELRHLPLQQGTPRAPLLPDLRRRALQRGRGSAHRGEAGRGQRALPAGRRPVRAEDLARAWRELPTAPAGPARLDLWQAPPGGSAAPDAGPESRAPPPPHPPPPPIPTPTRQPPPRP